MTLTALDWPRRVAEARQAAAGGADGHVVSLLSSAVADPAVPYDALQLLAGSLRRLGRNAEARLHLQKMTLMRPASAVAEHNLAAALGDAGNAAAAHDAARRALAKGGDAPETWLVLARALVSLSRLEEAQGAMGQALARRPDYAEALRDEAQLIWMRGGDGRTALARIDALLASDAATPALAGLRATIAREILGPAEAWRGLEPWLAAPHPPGLDLAASAAASGFDPALALKHAEAAFHATPSDAEAGVTRLAALMACGSAGDAVAGLDDHLARFPDDQYALALRYTAWRLLGDPRALSVADYQRLARAFDLTPPTGVETAEWLARAAQGLRALHPFHAEPLGQSIRSGVQAALDPRYSGDPAVEAIFAALSQPITDYIGDMAGRDDPMSRRAAPETGFGGYEIVGAWSVRLTAGGRHSDHIHPRGWVSSALYVETPELSPDEPRAGWLRLGGCRLGVGLELEPEHWVEARPGRVVLFPSWMWHGTEPFTGGGERLSIAFDVQPR